MLITQRPENCTLQSECSKNSLFCVFSPPLSLLLSFPSPPNVTRRGPLSIFIQLFVTLKIFFYSFSFNMAHEGWCLINHFHILPKFTTWGFSLHIKLANSNKQKNSLHKTIVGAVRIYIYWISVPRDFHVISIQPRAAQVRPSNASLQKLTRGHKLDGGELLAKPTSSRRQSLYSVHHLSHPPF